MKFEFNKNQLADCLEVFNSIIDNNNIRLSYRGILIIFNPGIITFIGGNGEMSAKKIISVKEYSNLKEEMKFLIDYVCLNTAISGLEKEELFFEQKDGYLVLRDKNICFKMFLMDTVSFPEIDFSLSTSKVKINFAEVASMFENTIFATAKKFDNLAFCSSRLILKKNILKVVSTDGFRLAEDFVKLDFETKKEEDIIVLNRNIRKLLPFAGKSKATFYLNSNKICIAFDSFIIQSNLLDIPYRDISKVFPKKKELTKIVYIEKERIMEICSKVTATLDEFNRKVNMWKNEKGLFFETVKENVGLTEYKVEEFRSIGNNFFISFDLKYLRDAIQPHEGEIIFMLNDATDRLILTSKFRPNNRQIISLQRVIHY